MDPFFLSWNAAECCTEMGTWVLGVSRGSCDAACGREGLVCSEAALFAVNSLIDEEAEFRAAMKQAGHTCKSKAHSVKVYDGGTSAAAPNFTFIGGDNSECLMTGTDRPLHTFDCAATQKNRTRLCWCFPAGVMNGSSYNRVCVCACCLSCLSMCACVHVCVCVMRVSAIPRNTSALSFVRATCNTVGGRLQTVELMPDHIDSCLQGLIALLARIRT